jgi:hypothetical protein
VVDAGGGADHASAAPFDAGPSSPVLPVVLIDVPGHGAADFVLHAPKVTGRIRIIEDHNGMHTSAMDLMGRPTTLDSTIGISLHGNSSSQYPQKSYSVELRDSTQTAVQAQVLGMPADSDWGLISCWVDKPCMRDPLAYTMGAQFGRWSPRFRHVEVYFNNVYVGLYFIVELPRRSRDRVAVAKVADLPGDVTGGYIYSREGWGEGETTTVPATDWVSKGTSPDKYKNQLVYSYRHPNSEKITPGQKAYLEKFVADFETMMGSPEWTSATTGYPAKIDVTSWIDYALTGEVTNNVDNYYKSMWFAKDSDSAGGKLSIWPIWDYNIAFGMVNYREGWKTDKLNLDAQHAGDDGLGHGAGGQCDYAGHAFVPRTAPVCDVGCCTPACQPATSRCWNMPTVPFYWDRLWQDPAFVNKLKCRWQELRKGPFSMAFVDAHLNDWKQQLEPLAMPRHLAKWPQLLHMVDHEPYVVDPTTAPRAGQTPIQFFESEIAWMRAWIDKRLKYLDSALPGTCPS